MLSLLLPSYAIANDEGTVVVNGDPSIHYIEGKIGKYTWAYFDDMVHLGKIKTVVLNSPGGYVVYAEAIAKLIRKHRINTVVRSGSGCFSACVLIFQSGVRRMAYSGSAFMLHPVTINVEGANVQYKLGTNRFRGMMMRYGMRVGALRWFGDGDTYFNAEAALEYGIATKVVK